MIEEFAGIWIFDPHQSHLTTPPPLSWTQHVDISGRRICVREEIERATGPATVLVDAVLDGSFYPVTGSPIADEISYTIASGSIHGQGRKSGATSFREVITIPQPTIMQVVLTFVTNGREVALGTARFTKRDE